MRLRKKSDSWFMRALGLILSPFTPEFMTSFWTTVGHTIYVPTRYDRDVLWGQPSWVKEHALLINHEQVHIDQLEHWGWLAHIILYFGPAPFIAPFAIVAWLFIPTYCIPVLLTALTVLSLPLSIGLAWGRFRIEREAYLTELRTIRDSVVRYRRMHDIALTLWHNYLWAWPPRWTVSWFDKYL